MTQEQLTTFYINGELFGIDVMQVQEVTGNPPVVEVPLAPLFVKGLINLRGQIATALGVRELFGAPSVHDKKDEMSVVCRLEGNLVSLIVDSIGDVVHLDKKEFEYPPETISPGIRKFLKGVYKLDGKFLSVIDLDVISKELNS